MRQSRVDNQEWTIQSGQSRVDNQVWTIKSGQSRVDNSETLGKQDTGRTQTKHNTETQKDEQHGSHQNPGAKPGASEW